MSWASRRRAVYLAGVIAFASVVIAVSIVWRFYQPPGCFDGVQNQGETASDKGGPCRLLDERALEPASVLWSRSFKVRDGSYSAVAYVENSNKNAGVRAANYRFGLYDGRNVLITERAGTAFIMPGGITPMFESGIDAGNREVARTYFEFTDPLVWERADNPADAISVSDKEFTNAYSAPRLEASATNNSVAPLSDLSFIAVIFSTSGNAFAASRTTLLGLSAGEKQQIVFTWPNAFDLLVGRVDVFPIVAPIAKRNR